MSTQVAVGVSLALGVCVFVCVYSRVRLFVVGVGEWGSGALISF